MRILTRVLGVATAAYGAAVAVKPVLLAGPVGLANATGQVPGGTQTLVRSLGARDIAIGLAMAAAPAGAAVKSAVAVRVAADLADAAVFGTSLTDPKARQKVIAVALGWGALCALAGFIGD